MAEGLMADRFDKSYLTSDVYVTITAEGYQGKIPSEVIEFPNFPSMLWIQTKQGSKRWSGFLCLCLDSSRSYKRNKNSINLTLHRKQATLIY